MKMRIPKLLSPLALVMAFAAPASHAVSQTLEVFIVAGQSNVDGSNSYWDGTPGKGPALTPENMPYATPYAGVDYAYAHVNPFGGSPPNRYLTGGWGDLRPSTWGMFAFEQSLGRELDGLLDNDVAIIKYTSPGTSLNGDWLPSQNRLYQDMVAFINDRLSEISVGYASVNINALFWHQGESDAGPPYSNNYAENFGTFFDSLKLNLAAPSMKAVLGQLNENLSGQNPHTGIVTINGEILGLAASRSDIAATASVNDLLLYDNIHFSSNGQVTLGLRMAEAYESAFIAVPEPGVMVGLTLGCLVFGLNRRRPETTVR